MKGLPVSKCCNNWHLWIHLNGCTVEECLHVLKVSNYLNGCMLFVHIFQFKFKSMMHMFCILARNECIKNRLQWTHTHVNLIMFILIATQSTPYHTFNAIKCLKWTHWLSCPTKNKDYRKDLNMQQQKQNMHNQQKHMHKQLKNIYHLHNKLNKIILMQYI